jgi:general secretion pathway protein C
MQYPTNQTEFYDLLLKLPQAKIAKALSAILLCYIAFLFAQLTWLIIDDKPNQTKSFAGQVKASATRLNSIDLTAIYKLNLFGAFTEQKIVKTVEVKDAPETTLKLTLSGTVASDDISVGSAIIENNGKQETYGIGDKITGTRAILESVANDRVLIKHSGRIETLMLDGFDYKKRQDNSSDNRTPKKQTSKAATVNSPKIFDQRSNLALSRSARKLKENLNKDPGKITDYLKIVPQRKNGNIIGYQLMPGRDAEFFKSSGLKSGDIATHMNGLDLTVPSEAAQALRALRQEQELSLLVSRNGEMTEILFSIQ